MSKAYRYRMPHNYFACEVEEHGFKAANATSVKPEIIPGFWPRWNGEAWEQVEDHRKRVEGPRFRPALNRTPRNIGSPATSGTARRG